MTSNHKLHKLKMSLINLKIADFIISIKFSPTINENIPIEGIFNTLEQDIKYHFRDFITKEKVVDIGDIQITADKKHNVVWSPILGIALLVIGGGVLLFGSSKK